MPKTKLVASHTQFKFSDSKASIVALIGPQGEGKTWAGLVAIIRHYQRLKDSLNGRPMKAVILRDSLENIKRMTKPSIDNALGDIPHRWKNDDKKLFLLGNNIEIDLIGISDPSALTRVQGAEPALFWLEEPAPVTESEGGAAGLSLSLFLVALSRAGRQPGTIGRTQITMNPADEDHWTYNVLMENPIQPTDECPDISTEVFHIPYRENKHINEMSRQATKRAYEGNTAMYQRYVLGEFAFIAPGQAVTPEYNELHHRSKLTLVPNPSSITYRLYDGGLNPTCVICQVTPSGHFHVLDTFRGEGIGLRQLIKTFVKPTLGQRYREVTQWRDIGDPAMATKEQADSAHSAAIVIKEELDGDFEPGAKDWQTRRESVKELLNRMVSGEPMLQISRHEGILNRALKGGWHYKVDVSGRAIGGQDAIPVKDLHSHPGDALSHGLPLIFETSYRKKPQKARRPPNNVFRTRLSYNKRRKQGAAW
jgi:hypothetical protein